ncbi:putative chitin- domain 3 protein [Botrytis fragariae]|uniref:Putative chitin- domain 3 protein n=1 Tax=Botrytis fragariae TaxID=1964551 RepID=A0A8H6AVG2_9HELO|nr:putative chitin- domain 3 protein [Botrytis fragariae]KAF5874371.1 putative chitin- domain 3 protein [Botrytis fragariae]
MFSKVSIVALALVAVSNAHMIMTSPVPYGVDTLNNSPLEASGADFPCKQRDGVYAVTTQNTMELGGSYDLAFKGSAVHGGGSCQVSITYDETPSASSTFKVIHSIVGGCPMKNIAGNNGDNKDTVDPDTYNFTIPSTLPAGKATLAWTWFNKVGNREMYMNCAPVTLTGGSSKRSDLIARDQAAFSALPDMFTANIGNGCSTADSKDVAFPNPGDSVEYDGGSTATATAAPTGSCAAAVSGAATAKPTGATTAVASYGTAPAATASSLPGGVFVSIATGTGVATSAATLAATSAVGVVPAVATTAVSVPITPTSVTSAVAPAGTGASSTSSSGALTGACTSEGMFNCISGTSYQQCGSGTWSVVMQMASGTTCTSGQTMSLVIAKRNGKGLMRHVARRGLGAEMFN